MTFSRRSFCGLAGLFAACILTGGLTGTARADQWSLFGDDYPLLEYAQEAAVVDGDGNTLFSLNGNQSMAMASTTKIMTATVALDSGMPLDTTYVVSDIVSTVYGQLIGYSAGETTTLNELLHGLLVYSGNDAAVCVAECVGGSVENFVTMMNAKAVDLGMTGTHYVNPHGLDEDNHYSTPLDLILLARYASRYPLFNSIVGSSYTVVTVAGEQKTFISTDELENSYPGIRGVKTGYTYNAGTCYVGVATRGGKTIYTCVLGCVTDDERWSDSRTLLDWAFSHYPESTIVDTGTYTSYSNFSDNLGWTKTGTFNVGVASRMDEALILTSEEYGSLLDQGDSSCSITYTESDGSAWAARTDSSGNILFASHDFGPLNSRLFY